MHSLLLPAPDLLLLPSLSIAPTPSPNPLTLDPSMILSAAEQG